MVTFTFARRTLDPGLFSDNAAASPPMRRGFTYITLVVHEAESCRDALIAAGASNSLRLMRLADRCLEVIAWRETGAVPVA